MKKKNWIPIVSIISAIALIISYNVMYNNDKGTANMKSYDINDYEVVEIYYDNKSNLDDGIHNEETERIRKQFYDYDGTYMPFNDYMSDHYDLCYTNNTFHGGYKKLEIDTNKIVVFGKDKDESPVFGIYDGNEVFCSGKHSKYDNNDKANKIAEGMKKFVEVLMIEEKRVITDKSKLYEYTTILTGSEPEKIVLDVDGKEYKGYDEIITKIEFIDQGETRLVKIDSTIMVEDEQGNEILNTQSYYKIVLKKDNSEFEEDYNQKYDEIKDVPYIAK